MKNKIKILILATLSLIIATSLIGCANQEDIDNAVKPLSQQITTINSTIDELENEIEDLQSQIDQLENALTALENEINCMHGKHYFISGESDNNGKHSSICEHCKETFEVDCDYGDWVDNPNGTKSKKCNVCEHEVVEKLNVTISVKQGVSLEVYWNSSEQLDLSTLIDITEGAGTTTYTLTSATVGMCSIEGTILSFKLIGDYTITVTTAETDVYNSASYTFTVNIVSDPATGEFETEWA